MYIVVCSNEISWLGVLAHILVPIRTLLLTPLQVHGTLSGKVTSGTASGTVHATVTGATVNNEGYLVSGSQVTHIHTLVLLLIVIVILMRILMRTHMLNREQRQPPCQRLAGPHPPVCVSGCV